MTERKKRERQIARQARIVAEGARDDGKKRGVEPRRIKHASRFHDETNCLLFI